MQLRKLGWVIRTLIAKPLYGKVGHASYIGPTLLVTGRKRINIGHRVRILPGMFAEALRGGSINIEDDVAIGQGFHVTALGNLSIGSGSTILGFVTVTDIDHGYALRGIPVHAQPLKQATTEIGKNCFIGMGARILAGSKLGEGSVVGANSVVRGSYAENSVIVGSPGRVIKIFNATTGDWDPVQ